MRSVPARWRAYWMSEAGSGGFGTDASSARGSARRRTYSADSTGRLARTVPTISGHVLLRVSEVSPEPRGAPGARHRSVAAQA
jgi:hypothetical protein